MARQITTYEEALARVAELFAKPHHPKELGIVHFQLATGSRFKVYPYAVSSQHALRDAKCGESLELVAVAYEHGALDIRNTQVAYRPLSAQSVVALCVGENVYHMRECAPEDVAVHVLTLGDEDAAGESSLFSRTCAACGKPMLQDDVLKAAHAFFAGRPNTSKREEDA